MKNVIFDLGAVLIYWNPEKIVDNFTSEKSLQHILLKEIFHHPEWLDMDRGLLSEPEFIKRASNRTPLNEVELIQLMKITRHSLIVITETLHLIEQIKRKGYALFCLSNMAIETYDFLRAYHSFWHLFSGIVISGLEKTIKPDIEIFNILLNRYSISPTETLFVDDNEDNTKAALKMGMSAVTFLNDPSTYQKIYAFLDMGSSESLNSIE